MSNVTINQLPAANTIDPVNDLLPIFQNSSTSTLSINRNTYLGLASAPAGLTDTQTMTNKTLTAPAVNNPVLGGTLTGTYVIGGTPTFPSSVVQLTTTQTLTNKTLTSPTINAPTITNATISTDSITGYTTTNSGTLFGTLTATTGNASFGGTLAVTGATTLSSTLAVTGASTLTGQISTQGSTAPPSAGLSSAGIKMSSTANLGIFFGNGAPTFSAAQGAIYLNTSGSGTANRLYVNTTGSTTWTNFTSAA